MKRCVIDGRLRSVKPDTATDEKPQNLGGRVGVPRSIPDNPMAAEARDAARRYAERRNARGKKQ